MFSHIACLSEAVPDKSYTAISMHHSVECLDR